MKVLQLGKFFPIRGGVEKVMYDLMVGLSGVGVRCDMLCAASEDEVIGEDWVNENAALMCTRSLAKVKATMISPAMISKLRSIAKDYDLIHIHHPDPMACLALRLSGFKGKVALHWHSDIIKQKRLLKLYKPLQNWLIKRADVIIGTSPVYLQSSPWLKNVQDKAVCLPIGIPPVLPQENGVEAVRAQYPGKKIIFSMGRLVPYKGYKYLVESARYLDDDHIILIGGGGPLRSELTEQIREYGLEDRVKLLGYLDDEDVPAYFGACDVFCLSSVYATEAFGIVQIEAMSVNKPIVATKIPGSGVSWVNEHGVSGINVEPENPVALADAFMKLTCDPEAYEAYVAGAGERFRKLFTKEHMIGNCLEIYNNL